MDSPFIISRIFTEILFPGFNHCFTKKQFFISYSTIIPAPGDYVADISVAISRLRETLHTGIIMSDADETERIMIKDFLKSAVKDSAFIMQLLTGREINRLIIDETSKDYIRKNCYEYSISLRKETEDIILKVILPSRFFNIFLPHLDTSIEYENIAVTILPFFKKSGILIPSIRLLFEKLDPHELSTLINIMIRNNKLSNYQMVLLIHCFPEYSLKLKNSLSKNLQAGVIEELKKYKGKVTADDMACGVYSVEESLGLILKKEKNFLSDRLTVLSSLIKRVTDCELYTRRDWKEWIEEVDSKNLMYPTLTKCNDKTIRDAFTDYSGSRYPSLTKNLTGERISEIFNGKNSGKPGTTLEARIAFIKNYRLLLGSSFRSNHEDFSYILLSVHSKDDYDIIVKNTGWFILSSALKGCSRKVQDRVISGINHAAGLLIKGVISGTINPDIIHDEIQVNRAKNECVKTVLSLYADGLIELDL